MIAMCSLCKTFLGEREPLADVRFTHGVCDPCVKEMERQADALFAKEPRCAINESGVVEGSTGSRRWTNGSGAPYPAPSDPGKSTG